MSFKVGDQVTYRSYDGMTETQGRVIQVEGGPEGELTEVLFPEQAFWMYTSSLRHS